MLINIPKPTPDQIEAYRNYYAPVENTAPKQKSTAFVLMMLPIVIYLLLFYAPNLVVQYEDSLVTISLVVGFFKLAVMFFSLFFTSFLGSSLNLLLLNPDVLNQKQKEMKSKLIEKRTVEAYKKSGKKIKIDAIINDYKKGFFNTNFFFNLASMISVYAVVPSSYSWVPVLGFALYLLTAYILKVCARLEIVAVNNVLINRI